MIEKNIFFGSLTYFLIFISGIITSVHPDYLFKDSALSLRTEYDAYLQVTCLTLVTIPLC